MLGALRVSLDKLINSGAECRVVGGKRWSDGWLASSVGAEYLVHVLDRHAAFADGGAAPLHRAGTDIAGGENVRHAGLEGIGPATVVFPRRSIRHGFAGFDEALLVTENDGRQPLGAGSGSDHGKHRRRFHGLALSGEGVFDFHGGQPVLAGHFPDLGLIADLDVVLGGHAARCRG